MPTQKAKSNPYKNQIYISSLKSFLNQCSDALIYIKYLFILLILFQSHMIRHSDMQSTFKDTPRILKHSRYLKRTLVLGHLCTLKALEGHSEGTRALKALRHLDTLGSQTHGHLGIRGTLFSRFRFFWIKNFQWAQEGFDCEPLGFKFGTWNHQNYRLSSKLALFSTTVVCVTGEYFVFAFFLDKYDV